MVELQKELVLARDFGQEVFAAEFHGRIELVVGKALESFDAEVLPIRGPTDGGFMSWDASMASFDDPLEDADILSEAGPKEIALGVFSEPIDVEDSRETADMFSHIEPVGKVVPHVVAAEREHRHRIAADGSDRTACGRGRLGALGGPEEYAVGPVEGLEDQGHGCRSTSTEDDRIDRHPFGVLPFGVDIGALVGRRGESGVGMGGESTRLRGPVLPGPIDQMARWGREAFPPHAVLVRQSDVGEDRVFRQRVHRVWVGLPGGTRRDAEEPGLGVDRMEFA